MKPDPLRTLLRLRQATLDEARRAVEEAIRLEGAATRRADDADRAIAREMQAALDTKAGDRAVEVFARWLPIGRREAAGAREEARGAAAAVDRARAILSLARAGVRAVETLIEEKARRTQQEQDRKAQAAADEVGLRRPPQDR